MRGCRAIEVAFNREVSAATYLEIGKCEKAGAASAALAMKMRARQLLLRICREVAADIPHFHRSQARIP